MIKLTSISEVFTMSDKVILTCTECLSRNYTTTKNKKTHLERIELSKFCKKCGKPLDVKAEAKKAPAKKATAKKASKKKSTVEEA